MSLVGTSSFSKHLVLTHKANMSVSATLYCVKDDSRTCKALIAAKYSGAKVTVDQSFVYGETNKTESFLKKFPYGKVPALETSEGDCISESNAVSWTLANEQLRGKTAIEQAQILQWISFADNEIVPSACTWVYPVMNIMPLNKGTTEKAKLAIKKALDTMDAYLLTRTFLVGEKVTLADISVCCAFLQLYTHLFDASYRKSYTNVDRWFLTMVHQTNVKAVLGDFKLCEKVAQFDGKKYAEFAGSAKGGNKQEKKPKEEKKEKKEQPKKVDKVEAAMEFPKAKDPLDALPGGTFNMDAWKRFYSNNEEAKSIEYFWQHFEKEHYSLWFCEYKYPTELSRIFMTSNLVGGMFQRLDKLRKNSFSSMCIFGEDNANNISGVWFWRGQELAFPLSEDWQTDYESYDWKKLDADSEETKKLVTQYFTWEGEDTQGRKFNQGKVFK